MANLLYLVHRLPYPPDKGDKVRSYHLLKHLAARHRVFLGTFIDQPEDEAHLEAVSAFCASLHVARIRPRLARATSLAALWRGEPLTTRYYRNAGLQGWVDLISAQESLDAAIVFSSAMAQYIPKMSSLPMLVDFVDVDSEKWNQYATMHRWPLSWLYKREGTELLSYERATAARARRAFFVSENEADLFRRVAPECGAHISTMSNGVNSQFFSPDPARGSPFDPGSDHGGGLPIVFTGAMDYWPNIDAVSWFAQEVLPRLRSAWPTTRFHIVGRNPSHAVRALASDAIEVTGTVADVRPYLQHAAVVVAPLRVARGIQNKILEAMAMGRPVVASTACAEAIGAKPDVELLTAGDAGEFVRKIELLLSDPARAAAMGAAGRQCVMRDFSWESHLGLIDKMLADFSNMGLAA
jgi:sugar transferase (PEP-CTERM/EpsH1 system associated)